MELKKELEGFGKAGSLIIKLLEAKLSCENGYLTNRNLTLCVFPRQELSKALKQCYNLNSGSYVYNKDLVYDSLKLLGKNIKICEPNKEAPLLLYDEDLMVFIAPRITEEETVVSDKEEEE